MKITEYFYHLKGRDNFVTKNHSHNEIELIQVICGSGSVLMGDKSYQLQSDYLYIIDARKPHIVHPEDTSIYVRNKIVIDADSFEAFCKESGLDKFVTHIMSLPPVFTYNDLSYDLLFKKVHELCSSGKKENSGFAHGYILEILHKAFLSESSYKNKGKDDVIQKILDIISEKDGITNLSEISEILHMNKYYVCHLFKDKTGINLSNYISEKLYERCIRIITHTSMSFEDTALECGFATTSSLTRFVKKKSGKCPKDIRRSSGN